MKTPKEILLKRHETAQAKLDAIRAQVVTQELASSDRKPARRAFFNPAFLATKLWQELIWPTRRIWTGLAAVWVGMLIFNYATAERGMVIAESPPPAPEVKMALREQRQMMAQLLGAGPVEPATRPHIPGPRSEERQTITAV